MRVVMYVMNDVSHDSRVRREATSLAAAGHAVTIVGTTQTPDEPDGSAEAYGAVTIVRVAIPHRQVWWATAVRAPWRTASDALRASARSLRRGPGDWPAAAGRMIGLVVLLPWLVARAAWTAVVNKALRRPVNVPGLDYLRRWQVEVLGWAALATRYAPAADVHHAHDPEALPAAQAATRRDRGRLVYDSHELAFEWGPILSQPRPLRWAFARWERRVVRSAAAVLTVNDAVAAEIEHRLSPRRVVVVHNCPPRWTPPTPPPDYLRSAVGLAQDAVVVLCHGVFQRGRGLEQTAAALLEPGLGGAHLVFLGYGSGVVEPILAEPRLAGRVHRLAAVPPDEVVPWVSGADVDVVAFQKTDLNKRVSTPNKLFESLAAGVPVVVSDFPILRRVVIDDPLGPLGAVCDPGDPAAIARAIRSIVEAPPAERAALRSRVVQAAHERWNWETESAKLVDLYADLAGMG